MGFEIQTDVFKIYLDIKGYQKSTKERWDVQWCKVDFRVISDFMNYHIPSAEILLSCEVESLVSQIDNLIHGRRTENISCIEPDLEFEFFPASSENDCCGEYMEIIIGFWSKGAFTADNLHICLDKKEAELLINYLKMVQTTKEEQ